MRHQANPEQPEFGPQIASDDIPVSDSREEATSFSRAVDRLFDASGTQSSPRRKRKNKKTRSQTEPKPVKGAPKKVTNVHVESAKVSSEINGRLIDVVLVRWDEIRPTKHAQSYTYTVQRKKTGTQTQSGRWAMVSHSRASNVFRDINAQPGFAYLYRIRATDEHGRDGYWSKESRGQLSDFTLAPLAKMNDDNQEAIARLGLNFDRLVLDKAILAYRRKLRGWASGDIHVANTLFELVKQAVEEKLISEAAGSPEAPEVFAQYRATRLSYLRLKRRVGRAAADTEALLEAAFSTATEEMELLRPVVLEKALAAFARAGVNVLETYSGYIAEVARRKAGTVIFIDKNSTTNRVSHDSKAEREARRADPTKAQPFMSKVNQAAALNGAIAPMPVMANHWGSRRSTPGDTPINPLISSDFDEGPESLDEQRYGGTNVSTLKGGAGMPSQLEYMPPQVVTSREELEPSRPEDKEASVEYLGAVMPAGSMDYLEAAIEKHSERLPRAAREIAEVAKTALENYEPPSMTVPVLRDAFIEAQKKENRRETA